MDKAAQNRGTILRLLLVFVIAGFFITSILDLPNVNAHWSQMIAKEGMNVYSLKVQPLTNYPPLLPFIFGLIGEVIRFIQSLFPNNVHLVPFLQNGLLKLPSIVTSIWFFSWLLKHTDNERRLEQLFILSATLWFNTVVWGQQDVILIVGIFLSFYYLEHQDLMKGAIFMALGLLIKLQFVYFFPLFFVYVLCHYRFKEWRWPFALGLGIFTVGWVPFMVINKWLTLPIKIYFGGANAYAHITINSFNLWGIVDPRTMLKSEPMSHKVWGLISLTNINYFILALILLGALILIIRKQVPIALIGMLYSLSVFTFTMSQHERYEMSVLAFVLLALVQQNASERNLRWTWIGVGFATLMNQLYVYVNALGIFNYHVNLFRTLATISTIIAVIILGWLVTVIRQNRFTDLNH